MGAYSNHAEAFCEIGGEGEHTARVHALPASSVDDVEAGAFVGGFPAFGFKNVIFELSSVDFFVDEGFIGLEFGDATDPVTIAAGFFGFFVGKGRKNSRKGK